MEATGGIHPIVGPDRSGRVAGAVAPGR